ncbi:MAG: HAD family phosphatase [Anaerolineales bacterium]|nr:HAD family phosphatase [Anaerolineales bacterium]
MKWSAVIFDMDGLMIDSESIALEVWRALAAEHGREVSEQLYRQVIGEEPIFGVRVIRKALNLPLGEEELLQEYWERRTEMMCRKVEPAPGLLELLDLLKRGSVSMAVASNSPCAYVESVLKALSLEEYFICIRSSEDVRQGKPAPDIYRSTLECLGIEDGGALVLEDSPAGIAAAKAASLTCYAVPNGDIPDGDFSAADRIFDSLHAVAAAITLD